MAEQPAITANTNPAPGTDPLLEQPDGQGVAVNAPPGALASTANAAAPSVTTGFFSTTCGSKIDTCRGGDCRHTDFYNGLFAL